MVTILYKCCKTRLKITFLQTRLFTDQKSQKIMQANKAGIRKTMYKREDVKKIRMNILTRYMEYVKNYDKIIESKFPTAMHLYRTFKGGVGEFYTDLKSYITVIRKLSNTTIKDLNSQEIELYYKMPRDMIKVAPVLVFSAFPFTAYFIFPITYYFPRQTLCYHFWTLQQRSEFQMYYLKRRLAYNTPTFKCMQAELGRMKRKNNPLFRQWSRILGLLSSGIQPNAMDILCCIELFTEKPYGIDYIQPNHVKYLLKVHGMSSTVWFRRIRLEDRARLLLAMDKAIIRENGPSSLSQESLKFACFMRGLNPVYVNNEQMIQWLNCWLKISQQVDIKSASLLLHCPILLGYNQPSNWRLTH